MGGVSHISVGEIKTKGLMDLATKLQISPNRRSEGIVCPIYGHGEP
jgi:hypothetical protein